MMEDQPHCRRETAEPLFIVRGLMTIPYLLCAFYLLYAAYRYFTAAENGDYSSLFYVIHGPVHEIGHFVFSTALFPEVLHVAGGTLFQCLVPVAAGWQFIWRREFPALAVMLGWFGITLIDAAIYMRDARVLKLSLVSPFAGDGEVIHDWFYLFSRADLLAHAEKIAAVTAFAGYLCIFAAAAAIIVMIVRGVRPGCFPGAAR